MDLTRPAGPLVTLAGKPARVGDFQVLRVLPQRVRRSVGPFCFLDHMGPRFMWWNFVSSRRERLDQAKADWKHRRFPLIPGDSVDRIPMPGE